MDSNPVHESLEHLDELATTEVGARLRTREEIGGIPGEAVEVTTTAVLAIKRKHKTRSRISNPTRPAVKRAVT